MHVIAVRHHGKGMTLRLDFGRAIYVQAYIVVVDFMLIGLV